MKIQFLIILLIISIQAFAQVGINTDGNTPHASAMLDVKSGDKGILVPRLSTAQRNAISNAATGLVVFDKDQSSFYFYDGNKWQNLANGGAWEKSSTSMYLSDNTLNVGIGTNTPSGKLMVKADANHLNTVPIFEVRNKTGQTILGVYDGWVEIYGNDNPTTKTGEKGGLEVAGYDNTKGITHKYFSVSDDSVRFYIADGLLKTGEKGGLEVAGYDNIKAAGRSYLRVTTDSTVISFDQAAVKTGEKGGLEVAAYDNTKATGNIELLRVTPDSSNIKNLTTQQTMTLPYASTATLLALENNTSATPIIAYEGMLVYDSCAYSPVGYNGNNWYPITNTWTCGYDSITDIDGNEYATVQIAGICWIRQNLKVTKYNDGTAITNVTNGTTWSNATTPAYCWYNNSSANKNTYGALYNWHVVDPTKNGNRNVCPTGWHVATDEEWFTTENFVDPTIVDPNFIGWRGTDGGKKLKATTTWTAPGNGTNIHGLNIVGSGYRAHDNGAYKNLGADSKIWIQLADSGNTSYAFYRDFGMAENNIRRNNYFKNRGMSIRCVKD